MGFDLHTHTSVSDGTFSPQELVAKAKVKGLKGIAITDHDTVGGIREALRAGKKLQVEVLPGIEISAYFEGNEVHILGYLLDWQDKAFQEKLKLLKLERQARARKIIERINELGYSLDYKKIQEIAGKGVIGRPHLAKALIEKGIVKDQKEAFSKFLGKGALAYFPRKKISFTEAIKNLQAISAVPVLAHPGKLSDLEIIEPMIEQGLAGLEVFHPDNGPMETEYLQELCDKNKLVPTGGTDFHGDIRNIRLGEITVSESIVNQLKKKQEVLYA